MSDRGKILIVDGSPPSAEKIREILGKDGYTVDSASQGKEALSFIPELKPDLVLLGGRLPDIDPFTFMEKMKEGDETRYIPVIFMTDMDDSETRLKAVELSDDLITGPCEMREVLARVERQVTVSKVRTALHESETKFRSVMESAIDAIISADSRGIIRSWNKAAMALFGFTEDDVIGNPIELIIPERFRERHRAGLKRVSSGGPSRVIGKTVEVAALRKDGSEFPVELSLATWFLNRKRYFTGIIRDITERKKAEESLRMSEQALREKTFELKEKNKELNGTLIRLKEMQNQLIMQEKMASLGKLSAGMAHELNNPAAASRRSAVQLREKFARLLDVGMKMCDSNLEKRQLDYIMELGRRSIERARQPVEINALARSDREAEVENLLEKRGIEAAWELAPTLVSLGYGQKEIDALAGDFSPQQFTVALDWLSCVYTIYSLLSEIGPGTDRIVEIVKALKTYTYMDRAPIQTVNIHEGMDNTLIILKNKLKTGITVHRMYAEDLPPVQAYGGELNQVWTNIIDNAVDAMSGHGTLTIRTYRDDSWIVVEIEDSGPGIPEEIQGKIFDPFFTTKSPGEGTGLGLNISRNLIVQKHKGQITVSSEPGRTCFTVRLPIRFEVVETVKSNGD